MGRICREFQKVRLSRTCLHLRTSPDVDGNLVGRFELRPTWLDKVDQALAVVHRVLNDVGAFVCGGFASHRGRYAGDEHRINVRHELCPPVCP